MPLRLKKVLALAARLVYNSTLTGRRCERIGVGGIIVFAAERLDEGLAVRVPPTAEGVNQMEERTGRFRAQLMPRQGAKQLAIHGGRQTFIPEFGRVLMQRIQKLLQPRGRLAKVAKRFLRIFVHDVGGGEAEARQTERRPNPTRPVWSMSRGTATAAGFAFFHPLTAELEFTL